MHDQDVRHRQFVSTCIPPSLCVLYCTAKPCSIYVPTNVSAFVCSSVWVTFREISLSSFSSPLHQLPLAYTLWSRCLSSHSGKYLFFLLPSPPPRIKAFSFFSALLRGSVCVWLFDREKARGRRGQRSDRRAGQQEKGGHFDTMKEEEEEEAG